MKRLDKPWRERRLLNRKSKSIERSRRSGEQSEIFARSGSNWAVFGLVLALAGCAGYRLGPTNGTQSGARSVEVRPFANRTYEPRLTEAVTQQLRNQLQQDGTYRLVTGGGGGEVVVTGEITRFEREPLSFQPRDVIATRDYAIHVRAHVRAVETASGQVLFDRDIQGRTTVRNVPDLGSAERQAAPLAAENLAQNIRSLLVDGTW